MRTRKQRDVKAVLLKKGFIADSGPCQKNHHAYYFLCLDGRKTSIATYFSHKPRNSDLVPAIMKSIKNQLRFPDANTAEMFFDCPLTKDKYVAILKQHGHI